ncbi:MAG: hypothetical protein KGS09_16075 [Nitrospirae bacterium]|nr:hypothetical protein [Nitrospirota bacterium]MBU6482054.1 hypothetical protein [Nitrospirota bacterium]MDE3042904.1 hypothetical protein [Nitrospirota bacterium]MDE3050196.1 hypothetical protein [Nitrospirota bacterium]MDE3221128.1 hypothetical protein [Nitrospirota bacterium]
MLQQVTTIGDQILEVVKAHPDCTVMDVAQQLPELSLSDMFLEVSRLNYLGLLLLNKSSLGSTITFRLP